MTQRQRGWWWCVEFEEKVVVEEEERGGLGGVGRGGVGWGGVAWRGVVWSWVGEGGDEVCAPLWISRERQEEMGFSLSMSTMNIFQSRYEFAIDNNWCFLSEVSLKCKLMMMYSDEWWMRKCAARWRQRTDMQATTKKTCKNLKDDALCAGLKKHTQDPTTQDNAPCQTLQCAPVAHVDSNP